jgi:hypothetical protein
MCCPIAVSGVRTCAARTGPVSSGSPADRSSPRRRCLDAERRIVATAGRVGARTISVGGVELARLEWSANNDGRTLNTGQAQMVRGIATTGRRVGLALARPGPARPP